LTLRRDLQILVIIGRHEGGVRIAQLMDQSIDRHLVEGGRILGIDIVGGDPVQYLLEETRLGVDIPLATHPSLQEPATSRHRYRSDCYRCQERASDLHPSSN